ncbi:ClpP/crotonase [Thozetella sp. PMI_491]|nr:ClpP/crotonase [Thozetella sp. PMI_491]
MRISTSLFAACTVSVLGAARSTLTEFINTTKVTSSYWRATFSGPPFNVQGSGFFQDFYALVDQLANDPDVKVVVFDSAVPDFWLAHIDLVDPIPVELTSTFWWGNITRLTNLPLLTVAAIRGITRGSGVEFAAALDVRFGSKEKAILNQIEVGFGLTPSDGLELLPRLVGRARALEIAIGSSDFDADTAAQYGWINRAISDCQFEEFIDTFARRVAGWDHDAIATTKEIINKRSGFPTMAEWQESFDVGQSAFNQPSVQARIPAVLKAGLQSNITFEKNLSEETLRFVGEGPFNHLINA